MTVALKNAVILSESNGQLRWVGKCDVCGNLDNTTVNDYTVTTGTSHPYFFCLNCKQNREVVLAAS
jgi:hypothetical protein